ncbi:hypothetical protein ACGFS9_19070 [Streptomyces sp. NPDC048566]|uniref:hypothetical protein n=1 Tax=Streptomyces sp. NPDC048566 TaxID=3365569 RepID=UPI003720D204
MPAPSDLAPRTGIRIARDERLVRELGTAHIVTAVLALPAGGHVWARRPGPARDAPLPLPGPATASSLRTVSDVSPVGLALAEPDQHQAGVLRYPAPGVQAAATLLRVNARGAGPSVREAVRGLGTTLRLLHAQPAPETGAAPPAPARLSRWLRSGHGPGATRRLYAAARSRLGDRRLGSIADWADEAPRGSHPRVLLHGGPALGGLVLPVGSGRPVLLTGEEATGGSWEFDVAWQLAEFAEMAAGVRWGVCGPADHTGLARAFLDGYGRQPSPAAARRAVAVRSLTHAHDFAAYVTWHSELTTYLDLVAEAAEAAEAPDAAAGWDATRVCSVGAR